MNDLLTSTLDAHGGLSRWREIEAFQLKVSIGGELVAAQAASGRPARRDSAYPGSSADCHDHAVRWRGAHRALHARPYGSRMPMVASLRSVPRHGLRSAGTS